MEIFELFETVPYTFLRLDSEAGGQEVIAEYEATGILKDRDGLVRAADAETHAARTTLHIRPDEAFISLVGGHQSLVGHGIRAFGVDYRIQGETPGRDFDSGSDAFYLCTLERTQTWVSALPLE